MIKEKADALVVFTPSGKRGRFPLGTSALLGAARELGVDIDSVCGGRGICGRCKCLVAEGEFAKFGVRSDASPPQPDHGTRGAFFAAREGLQPGFRLTCHATLQGDLVIDVPASSQVHHQVIRKDYESHDIVVNPVIHLHYVQVAKPRLDKPRGDLERLFDALQAEWQLEDLRCEHHVLPGLQASAFARAIGIVTVAVREGREIVGIWPGFKDRLLGVAVDVGSTTLAAHLCDLASGEVIGSAGVMNPQIRFGEDLMSRVSYVMLNPGGDVEMTRAVREALNALIAEAHRRRRCDPRRRFRIDIRRQSDHAPPAARDQPGATRRVALLARHGLGDRTYRLRRSTSPSQQGRGPTSSRASLGTSAPTRRRCCSPKLPGKTMP